MKIIHFSDTHLGYNDLEILNGENINQREADFYDAFSQVVAQIKIIRPDYIIHTGDLFHRSSPSNRAITFALHQPQKKGVRHSFMFIYLVNSKNTTFVL